MHLSIQLIVHAYMLMFLFQAPSTRVKRSLSTLPLRQFPVPNRLIRLMPGKRGNQYKRLGIGIISWVALILGFVISTRLGDKFQNFTMQIQACRYVMDSLKSHSPDQ